jgi:uncharacterized protein YbaP (TraB family)
MILRSLLLGLAGALAAGAVHAQPPVWVVRDADSELVLFGSIHVLPPNLDWTPPALTRDLAKADDLWFELPIDPAAQSEVAALAVQRGLAPAGQPLSGLLSADGKARLARVCAKYGLSPAALEGFQPWYAEVAIAWVMFRQAGAEADEGVEKQVAARAPASAGRRAFETPAQQIALFADTPLPEQVASLEQSLEEIEETPDQMNQLVADWMAGDIEALDRDALDPLREASPAIFKRLITERNARWVQALDARLKGAGRTVVVVGMGHMIGPDGLPARLRALGYSVEGP